ncbi:MAG: sigma-70 family RNA polymerase sigma factor [bacterium]|nr:sigma-70 family RNA polymerase sigma factor [bacterium]
MVALSYLLSGRSSVAEDLAQEAFLRAHRDWDRVGRMAASGAWVRRVAVNLTMSRFRRLRSEAAARLRLTTVPGVLDSPGAEYDAFWAEVRALPPRQAQAVALRYVEDMSVAEIAETLEIATGIVKALLHQGRERLQRQLRAKGWGDGLR